jgi:hypothetical protein
LLQPTTQILRCLRRTTSAGGVVLPLLLPPLLLLLLRHDGLEGGDKLSSILV